MTQRGRRLIGSLVALGGGLVAGLVLGHGIHARAANHTIQHVSQAMTQPFSPGSATMFSTVVESLSGHATALARGPKATVVMAMASWCRYCGYEDKWVLPQLAKTPGVAIDVVDVSPQGGIADPGPQNPPFSGHDGQGGPLTVAGMETTMQYYVTTFGTLSASNIHVYVAPQTTQSAWNIQSFPTLAFLGANGTVAVAPNGAQTLSQAQADLQQTLDR